MTDRFVHLKSALADRYAIEREIGSCGARLDLLATENTEEHGEKPLFFASVSFRGFRGYILHPANLLDG